MPSAMVVDLLPNRAAGAATRVLRIAFREDPVIGYFMPERAGRRRQLAVPGLFRSALAAALPMRRVYGATVDGELAGVAIWFPYRMGDRPAGSRWRSGLALLPTWAAFPRQTPRLLRGFGVLAQHHPKAPHWYLAFVGVLPEHQNSGLGARLLAPVLAAADEGRTPCYLETPFPRTHPFYRRLGFHRQEEIHAFGAGPPVVTFLREPQTG